MTTSDHTHTTIRPFRIDIPQADLNDLRDLAGGRRHPRRVIDEVMEHEATGRSRQHHGSAMGAHYPHTTPEMAARIAAAIEQRLTVVLEVAEQALEARPGRSTRRVL